MSNRSSSLRKLCNKNRAGILAFGLLLSAFAIFGGGDYASESIQNSSQAWRLAQSLKGYVSVDPELIAAPPETAQLLIGEFGVRSTALLLPLAVLYSIFGVNSLVTLALPLLSFLFTVYLVYKIGESLQSAQMGFWAAFLFVLIPQNLFHSSVYSLVSFSLLFSLLSIYLVIESENTQSRRTRLAYLFAALLSGGLVFLLAEWGLGLFAILAVYLLRDRKRELVTASLIFFFIWLGFFVVNLGFQNTSLFTEPSLLTEYLGQAGGFLLLPVAIIGAIQLQNTNKPTFFLLSAWLSISLLWFTPFYYSGGVGQFPLALVPLILFAAAMFAKPGLQKTALPILICLSILLLVALGLSALNPQRDLVPGLAQQVLPVSWQVQDPLLTISQIVGGLLIYVLIFWLLVANFVKRRAGALLVTTVAVLITVSMFAPIYSEIIAGEPAYPSPEGILAVVTRLDPNMPLYIDDPLLASQLRYAQGFASRPVDIRTLDNPKDLSEDAYVLFHQPFERADLATWRTLEQFRSRDQAFWLASNQRGSLNSQSQTCETYAEWANLVVNEATEVEFIPIFHPQCFEQQTVDGDSLIRKLLEREEGFSLPGRAILTHRDYSTESQDYNLAISYHPFDSIFYDNSSLFMQRELEPGSFYLFSIRMSADGLASPLYWRIGDQEGVLFVNVALPEPADYAVLLFVPANVAGQPAYISPALFADKNTILHLYDLRFSQVDPTLVGTQQ